MAHDSPSAKLESGHLDALSILNSVRAHAGCEPLGVLTVAVAAPVSGTISDVMAQLILQLAIIIIAARVGGGLVQRYLRLPRVIGELAAGMVIGPYALGALRLPGLGPLFPIPAGPLPVMSELYGIATFASVVLLFHAGLATDLKTFLRYSATGSAVGMGGALVAFVLGDLCTVWFGGAETFLHPAALFMGVIATATSVGITVRVLSEKNKMDSPEGVTIMAAAVLDDVIGILFTAVVVGLSRLESSESSVDWAHMGLLFGKALGFWLVCTVAVLLFARRIADLVELSRNPSTITAVALGLALLLAGLTERAGLALIIGAYVMGLALSRTDLALFLQGQLKSFYEITVPVFFCVMGMLVNWSALQGTVLFGLTYALVAAISKLVGCGLPARLIKFNTRGSLRIGLGMLPRAEVALIVAGMGLSSGLITSKLFGVVVMMCVINTLVSPGLLTFALRGGTGMKRKEEEHVSRPAQAFTLELPSADLAEFLLMRITRAFQNEEFFVNKLHTDTSTYQMRKEDMLFTLFQKGPKLVMTIASRHAEVARMIVAEELLTLKDLMHAAEGLKGVDQFEEDLLKDLFEG